jgi:hypothetical protein
VDGDYIIASLPIGAYKITATLRGFRQAVMLDVVLQVDQKARIDINLEVGEINNQVTVAGTAPLVETESSSVVEKVVRLAAEKVARENDSRAELMQGAFLRDVFDKYGVL